MSLNIKRENQTISLSKDRIMKAVLTLANEITNKNETNADNDELLNSLKEQKSVNEANLIYLTDPNTKCKSKYEEPIAKKLNYYLHEYGFQLMAAPIQNLHNIFNHEYRTDCDNNLAYELIFEHYLQNHDTNILTLLQYLDGSKLKDEYIKGIEENSAFGGNLNHFLIYRV